MEIQPIQTPEVTPVEKRKAPEPQGGIYDLPICGRPARGVRGFYDDMRPMPEDSVGVTVGKQILRYGTVIAAGTAGVAVGAIVAL